MERNINYFINIKRKSMKRKLLFSVMSFVSVLVFSQKQYIDPQPKPPTYENSLQETHVPSVGSQHIPIGGSDPQFSLPVQNDDWLSNRDLSQYKMESAIQPLEGSIRYDHLKKTNHNWVPNAKKIINKGVEGKIEMYKEVPIKETHTLTEDGTWKPKHSSHQVGVNNVEKLIKNALLIACFIGVFIIVFIVIRIINKRKNKQNIAGMQNIMVDSMVRKGFHSNDMGKIYGKKQSEITPPSLSQSKKGGFSYNGGHNRY